MSKYSSMKYYQINQEKLQRKLLNNIKVFRRKKKLKKATIWSLTTEKYTRR